MRYVRVSIKETMRVTRRWLGRQVLRRFKVRRKTKAITILVQEVYLRDDVSCGSTLCQSCVQEAPPLPAGRSHYLVPDADALLRFLEIWELPQITSVIYLASVVKEVLTRCNQKHFRKLRSLFTDRRRQSLYFDDEHSIYTWSLQRDANNAGQYSVERVEEVASWFYEHLQEAMPIIVLRQCQSTGNSLEETCETVDQFKSLSLLDFTAGEKKVEVLNIDTYVRQFWHHDSSVSELYASLSLSEWAKARKGAYDSQPADLSGRKVCQGASVYKEHLPVHLLEEDVASGALHAGVFCVNKRKPLDGYIQPSKGHLRLIISVQGRQLQNRALPGDLVAVRVLDNNHRSEMNLKISSGEVSHELPETGIIVNHLNVLNNDDTGQMGNDLGEDIESIHENFAEAVLTGEVVGILQRFRRDYVACLDEEDEALLRQSNAHRREHVLCIPMDRRVPMVGVATRLADHLVGQRFVIRIDGWERVSRIPRGHFVQLLGPIGDLNVETMALLVENGICTAPFSSASMRELPEDTVENPWIIPDAEFAYRRDLRHSHRTCSIDPPGSKDVDDALSVRWLSNGLLEIGVHIADVAYFVRQDSLIDLEARARGTTVYMVGRSWQMLPGVLSENLCSLIGGKDRLAVSVIWTIDPENDFKILDVWFGRTIIQSRQQLFYEQAQAILDGHTLPTGWEIVGGADEVASVSADLLVLANFAQHRRDLRRSLGAVELASSELHFKATANTVPMRVDAKIQLPINWIVAELMIFANYYVAQKIYWAFPSKSLLRRHDPPRLDSFTSLLECCRARGFTLDTSSNKDLARSLDRMRDSSDPIIENAFRALATKAMSEAEYHFTGESRDRSGFYHYGLALEFYTHFTSPIRRYADILVHRMLIAACGGHSGLERTSDDVLSRNNLNSGLPGMELREVIQHLNERHRASKRAQKECNELYLLMYLQKHAEAEPAVVIDILDKGMMVFVPKYDVRSQVYLQDKKDKVILPAEDDSTLNDFEEPLPLTLETRVLLKGHGRLTIFDTQTARVLQEYKLMDTVWIQLRADGSRAHAPKLRLRLLSPAHPAAKSSIQNQNVSGKQRRFGLRSESVTLRSAKSHQRETPKVDNNKPVNKMAQIVAMEISQAPAPRSVVSLKRKDSGIQDVTKQIKRLKAPSVFLDLVENNGIRNVSFPSSMSQTTEDNECADDLQESILHNGDCVKWTELTVSMIHSRGGLSDQQFQKRLESIRRKRLSHAAKWRAVRMWSALQDNCVRQSILMDKENHSRSRADTLGLFLQDCRL